MAYPLREDFIERDSEATVSKGYIKEFGFSGNRFHAGEEVEFHGLRGVVEEWYGDEKSFHMWAVPINLECDQEDFITFAHSSVLKRVEKEPQVQVAQLGSPELSGVWQPTGERFELLFYGHDPVGTFYIRERQHPSGN